MGLNFILPLIVGIAMTTILGTAIGPSFIEKIKATKVEATTINNQEVIFEAVQRYITLEQKDPDDSGGTTPLEKVINKGYLNANVNNNGFDGTYSILVENAKGILNITTIINDTNAQKIFLNSFKNKFKPTCADGINAQGDCINGKLITKFVIPMNVKHGSGLFMTGIPIGDNAPTNDSKYWYDTSKGLATLKMKADNGTWKVVAMGGGSSISEDSLYSSGSVNSKKDIEASTGSYIGEIKYAYDSTINTIQEYVYTGDATKGNNGWVIKGSGGGSNPSIGIVGLDPIYAGCPYGYIPIPNSEGVDGAPIGRNPNISKHGWCVMKYMLLPYEPAKFTYVSYGLAWQDAYDLNPENYKVISRANNSTDYLNYVSNLNAKNICKNHIVNDKGEFISIDFESMSMTYNIYKILAKDLFLQAQNWTGGNLYDGSLYVGHSDTVPYKSIPPHINDDNGYFETGNNSTQAVGSGKEQRRTMYLSNGAVIWDINGNFWEQMYEGQNASNNRLGWREYKNINKNVHPFSPNVLLGVDASTYDSSRGLGMTIYDNDSASIGSIGSSSGYSYWLLRGSTFNNGTSSSGLSASYWYAAALSDRNDTVSGRCVAKRLFK